MFTKISFQQCLLVCSPENLHGEVGFTFVRYIHELIVSKAFARSTVDAHYAVSLPESAISLAFATNLEKKTNHSALVYLKEMKASCNKTMQNKEGYTTLWFHQHFTSHILDCYFIGGPINELADNRGSRSSRSRGYKMGAHISDNFYNFCITIFCMVNGIFIKGKRTW